VKSTNYNAILQPCKSADSPQQSTLKYPLSVSFL
jgi:hypothetical protein